MKCPKCGYLGFEHAARCRHCGYEFSLASTALSDLPMRSARNAPNPIDDLALIDAATAPPPDQPMTDAGVDLDRVIGGPDPAPEVTPQPRQAVSEPTLFGPPIADDEPLIRRASAPRAPLAVRRATPEIPRLRVEPPRPQALELDLGEPAAAPALGSYSPADRAQEDSWPEPRADRPDAAPVGARFVAMAIDVVLLAAIDAAVIYFTMQICELPWSDIGVLPKAPLLAFLLVLNGGYLIAFTASGQTLGKMATGIRVVGTESAGTMDLGRAVTRTAVWALLAAPAGLGFLTLFGDDHRGLHDRCAGTRVVRAPA